MANYHDARIPLELLNTVFGHTKLYPHKLLVPEVEKCEFNVLSDGSAEIFFDTREDYDGSTRQMPPTGPTRTVRVEATKGQALDCVAHSGVFDVTDGMIGVHSGNPAEISEDWVRQALWDESKALVWSYLCLFKLNPTDLVEYEK